MNCSVSRSILSGSITCPPNKSYTHRAIFLASLAGQDSRVTNALVSGDTISTIRACQSLGASMDIQGDTIMIHDSINPSGEILIDAANSGTTIRLASAISAAYPCTVQLTGDASLQKRPMQPLLDSLEMAGAICASTDGCAPLRISGPMSGGTISVQGNLSSQFVSALMMAAPLTSRGLNVNIQGEMVSKPYLDMSLATMRHFGVGVRTILPYKMYEVQPQMYRPTSFTVPLDYSSMALLLSAAVLCGSDLEIRGCMDELPQGDEVFIDILDMLGVDVRVGNDATRVSVDDKLNGGTFNLGNSPDLLPPLAILALNTSKPITITDTSHARLKETDRISIIASELAKLGVGIKENSDGMVLYPSDSLHGATLDSHDDHRLFMAFCIAAMYVGDCTVTGAESAAISYPNFIDEIRGIGAKIDIT
ncbi:MAG: 3-phosphoshikimate 1-carboxyvinyltransferase [Cenarchaeum sp. SB0665_bin_23]|nr:3-phosphoshikimate 1-carboxyvinyltransferase [Cenarchaeum sp. SB0665_bin_23]MYG33777.1 3-phosphoshikimate 1-carboxyvinyltransferase [Cenarchaeum sp. SB0677_bin_16]